MFLVNPSHPTHQMNPHTKIRFKPSGLCRSFAINIPLYSNQVRKNSKLDINIPYYMANFG